MSEQIDCIEEIKLMHKSVAIIAGITTSAIQLNQNLSNYEFLAILEALDDIRYWYGELKKAKGGNHGI